MSHSELVASNAATIAVRVTISRDVYDRLQASAQLMGVGDRQFAAIVMATGLRVVEATIASPDLPQRLVGTKEGIAV